MMFLRFIRAVACVSTSLLFMAEYYSIAWIYNILFIHSLADEHLGCCHSSAIMNNAALNIPVQVFMGTYVFSPLGYMPSSGIAGSQGNSTFNFLRDCQTISLSGRPLSISSSV